MNIKDFIGKYLKKEVSNNMKNGKRVIESIDQWLAEKRKELDILNHIDEIRYHYEHAIEKHPDFCDWMMTANPSPSSRMRVENILRVTRRCLDYMTEQHKVGWDDILDCELWEIYDALAHGDKAQAVSECYDAIAVLLRTVDVLEGRQALGENRKEEAENGKAS